MALILRQFGTPKAFASSALTFLLEHEVEHCLTIGLIAQAIEQPDRWDGPITMVTIERDGVPVAVAIRTPPNDPIISRVDEEGAITLLVEHFSSQQVAGVMAPIEVGALFAAEWSRRTGQTATLAIPERIYKLEQVRPVTGVAGTLRRANVTDRELLIDWTTAFIGEAFGERQAADLIVRAIDARLRSEQSGYAVWEDGRPVCLIGYAGPTPDGIRIGPVYTPPEFRRRGYGSAATAELSRQLIEEGRKFCVLFADLDNLTSNRIYQAIGYEPVADVGVYRFTSQT